MLVELAVRDLGVIENLRLRLEPGMTVLTGETGAGKTMVVEAIALLMGGKADPARVRPGAEEAVVEGLFIDGDSEYVLRRVIPANGRSRSYIDRSLTTAKGLAELGSTLVEICGQHSHQRLLTQSAQRNVLDSYASIDLEPLRAARASRREIVEEMATLGGDERSRAREIDLLQYQLDELVGADLSDPAEDDTLSEQQDQLSDAVASREAATEVAQLLGTDGGAAGLLSDAVSKLDGRTAFGEELDTLQSLYAQVSDLAHEIRSASETIEENPERLDEIRRRRQLLVELRRKYGDSLADVISYRDETAQRLDELRSHETTVARLQSELDAAEALERSEAAIVREARLSAAPKLADAVKHRLANVAMGSARVEVSVEGDGPGDDVEIRLAANPGMDALPIASAASGGELSRTMLALHLELSAGAPTMIFDEVDAGLGGEAAVAVGRSLASLATDAQVLVVTHLPQVAAYADHQLSVEKSVGEVAVSTISLLDENRRIIELSRMLSGAPDSDTGRSHAAELLETAAADRRN